MTKRELVKIIIEKRDSLIKKWEQQHAIGEQLIEDSNYPQLKMILEFIEDLKTI